MKKTRGNQRKDIGKALKSIKIIEGENYKKPDLKSLEF